MFGSCFRTPAIILVSDLLIYILPLTRTAFSFLWQSSLETRQWDESLTNRRTTCTVSLQQDNIWRSKARGKITCITPAKLFSACALSYLHNHTRHSYPLLYKTRLPSTIQDSYSLPYKTLLPSTKQDTVTLYHTRHEEVPLVEFMYLAFTRMPGKGWAVGDSGLCCCVCVMSFER